MLDTVNADTRGVEQTKVNFFKALGRLKFGATLSIGARGTPGSRISLLFVQRLDTIRKAFSL